MCLWMPVWEKINQVIEHSEDMVGDAPAVMP